MLIGVGTFTGTLPTWIILALGLLIAWRISKGGGGSAVSELSKANEVLTKRTHELGGEVRDLKVENERLKARTDFAQALAPLLEHIIHGTAEAQNRQEAIIETLEKHETRAQQRFEQTTGVLGLIADRLGPEEKEGT